MMKDRRNERGRGQKKRRHLREAREVTAWVTGDVKERRDQSLEGRGEDGKEGRWKEEVKV